MSAYLSIHKTEEDESCMVVLPRLNKAVIYIMNNVSNFKAIDTVPVSFIREQFTVAFEDIQKDIDDFKEITALTIIKGNYEVYEMRDNIVEYEELLMAKGMLRMISEMMVDNGDILYLTYG